MEPKPGPESLVGATVDLPISMGAAEGAYRFFGRVRDYHRLYDSIETADPMLIEFIKYQLALRHFTGEVVDEYEVPVYKRAVLLFSNAVSRQAAAQGAEVGGYTRPIISPADIITSYEEDLGSVNASLVIDDLRQIYGLEPKQPDEELTLPELDMFFDFSNEYASVVLDNLGPANAKVLVDLREKVEKKSRLKVDQFVSEEKNFMRLFRRLMGRGDKRQDDIKLLGFADSRGLYQAHNRNVIAGS